MAGIGRDCDRLSDFARCGLKEECVWQHNLAGLVEDEHGKGIAHVHQEWTMRLPTSIPAIACKIIPHPFKRQTMTEPANDRRM